ncbi:MAG: 50S ribosomal protein L19 [Candidatus Sungbacteria bacterium]|nr:50S ribosomal protein L19 [Candidatus Sungbacteria bacterium]
MPATSIEQANMRANMPEFRTGDTVKVTQKIKEGEKERSTSFEGIVIARKHGTGISATFTVRRVVDGIGVERIFPLHSPLTTKIEVLRRANVRRAKLYYIRDKAAREVRRKMKAIINERPPKEKEAPAEEKAEEK